jgi:hypothetical protein
MRLMAIKLVTNGVRYVAIVTVTNEGVYRAVIEVRF